MVRHNDALQLASLRWQASEVGLTLGAGIGPLVQRLHMSAWATSVSSAVLAWLVATVVVALIWLRWTVDDSGIRAVSVDLVRLGCVLLACVVAASILHLLVGWLGETVPAALAHDRWIVVGLVAGFVAAIGFGWSISGVSHGA